jgi:hypothetical protein
MRYLHRVRWLIRVASLIVCATIELLTMPQTAAIAATGGRQVATASPAFHLTGWVSIGSYDENTLDAGEGVATVSDSHHRSQELYRGLSSVSNTMKAQGWAHIGDPDSTHGFVFDAYQGPSTGHSKMFLVTNRSGKTFEYLHTLVPGELYNNSFVAVSPNTQWMVAGEWNTMNHLQIYPTPHLNPTTSPDGGSLRLAGYIKLDHEVNDVQGCDFVTPARLICASDDDSKSLFANEKPLVQIDLSGQLHRGNVEGHVIDLGSIPQESSCSGTFEAEGVDFDPAHGILRVEMIQPANCILKTTIYEFRQAGGR